MKRLESVKHEAWLCNHCSMCSESINDASGFYTTCPVYRQLRFEDSSARGHNTVAFYLLQGILKYDKNIARNAFDCTTCYSCEEICKPMGNILAELGGSGLKTMIPRIMGSFGEKFDPVQSVVVIEAMRADCVDLGLQPESLKKMAESTDKNHNPYGEPHSNRMKWAAGLDLPQNADTVLFVGCNPAYRRQEIAQSTAKILKATGLKFAVLPDEWCCGSPMLRAGNVDIANKMIWHNVELLRQNKVKNVVTACAEGYRTISNDWPRIAGKLPFEVFHITQVRGKLVPSRKMKFKHKINATVTYHDPCHLGRVMGIYDEPREILKAIPGIKLVEMYPTKHAAWCCGAGGGLKDSNPELALTIGTEKIKLIKETGATMLVSSCPFCKAHFQDVMEKNKESIKVKDITELMAESMGV